MKSFIVKNHRRFQKMCTIMATHGGFFRTIYRAAQILKNEGWNGVRNKWRTIRMPANDMAIVGGMAIPPLSTETSQITQDLWCPHPGFPRYKEIVPNRMKPLILEAMNKFPHNPTFSILLPVDNTEMDWLHTCIDSVCNQIYPHWELCITLGAYVTSDIEIYLNNSAENDHRIRLAREKPQARASANEAFKMAGGHFVCVLHPADSIPPFALYELASKIVNDPPVDIIYGDEDQTEPENHTRHTPYFKADWSPETLEGCMYTGNFVCYRTELIKRLGGIRDEFGDSRIYDLILHATELTTHISHLPKILYHWRRIPGTNASPIVPRDASFGEALIALENRVKRTVGDGTVRFGRVAGCYDVRYAIKNEPLVSVIIPTAGFKKNFRALEVNMITHITRHLREATTYNKIEIIIVDNQNLETDTIKTLQGYNCRFVHYNGPMNIAAKMNLGAREAHGEYLLFLNDDVSVLTPDWLENMLQLCQRDGVGVVGAKLYFANGLVQHGGACVLETHHIYKCFPVHRCGGVSDYDAGYSFPLSANLNCIAVTGAVSMTSRVLFDKLGGFEERLAVNFNDIDYCFRSHFSGNRVVMAANARLWHMECASRTPHDIDDEELNLYYDRWVRLLDRDPYFPTFFFPDN